MPPVETGRSARPSAVLGLAVAGGVAAAAWLVAGRTPATIGAVPVAIVAGLAVGHLLPRRVLAPGLKVATGPLLKGSVALLGAQLGLADIAEIGAVAALAVPLTLGIAVGVATGLGRLWRVDRPSRILVSVGSAICGNSAILATAPVLGARRAQVGAAVVGVTLWGTVALLLYPLLGVYLGLGDGQLGLWLGLAIQDTSQVVAAGATVSETTRDVATVVKLLRNACLLVALPLVAVLARTGGPVPGAAARGRRAAVPGFVLGFLAASALVSLGVMPAPVVAAAGTVASCGILVAVAGLGASLVLADLRRHGGRSVMLAGAAAVGTGLTGLVAALTLEVPLG